jgi:hypothetical protein
MRSVRCEISFRGSLYVTEGKATTVKQAEQDAAAAMLSRVGHGQEAQPKSVLNELCQANRLQAPLYLPSATGPDHERVHRFAVLRRARARSLTNHRQRHLSCHSIERPAIGDVSPGPHRQGRGARGGARHAGPAAPTHFVIPGRARACVETRNL